MPNYTAMSDEQLAEHLTEVGNYTDASWNGAVRELERRTQIRVSETAETLARSTLEATKRLSRYTLLLTLSTALLGVATWTVGAKDVGLELNHEARVFFIGGGFVLVVCVALYALLSLISDGLSRK